MIWHVSHTLKITLRGRKPPTASLSLPRVDGHKRPRPEEGPEVAVALAPTAVRTDLPPSKGKRIEESSLQRVSEERAASDEAIQFPFA